MHLRGDEDGTLRLYSLSLGEIGTWKYSHCQVLTVNDCLAAINGYIHECMSAAKTSIRPLIFLLSAVVNIFVSLQ